MRKFRKSAESALKSGLQLLTVGTLVTFAAAEVQAAKKNPAHHKKKAAKAALISTHAKSKRALKTSAAPKSSAARTTTRTQMAGTRAPLKTTTKTEVAESNPSGTQTMKPKAASSATFNANGGTGGNVPSADASTPRSSVSSSTVASEAKKSPYVLTFFGLYSGPSLGYGSQYLPDDQGNLTKTAQNMDSALTAGYHLTDNVVAAVGLNFFYKPVGMQDFVLEDPAIKFSNAKLISKGKLNMFADLRFYLPASQASQNAHEVISIRSTQSTTYEMGKFTLGLISWERYYAFSSNADFGGANNDFYLYGGPNIAFQLTPTVAASVLYEMAAKHVYGDAFGSDNISSDGTDLEPGLSWDITPKVNFSPFLNIYTGGKVSMESTSINFLFSAKFL